MTVEALASYVRARPTLKEKIKTCLHAVGYDTTDWVRVVMYRECFSFIRSLGPESLDVLEISPGPQWRREFAFRSYTGAAFPEFDLCEESLPERFDLIIADQVFEHLKWPRQAARNVYQMLKPGGYLVASTPFLIRVHKSPTDCSRWTEEGLAHLLQEGGFPSDGIRTNSWGNKACLKANLTRWRKRGFLGSLANEPDFPVIVWAFARKRQDGLSGAAG